MAKRHAVKSTDTAATSLRRPPRFKIPNPKQPIASPHSQTFSSNQTDFKSTPSSDKPKRSNSANKIRVEGKKTCAPNTCVNVVDKEAVLGSVSARKRSPRFAKSGTTSVAQDGDCARKKKGCTEIKFGFEGKTYPESVFETASDEVASETVGTTSLECRKSARLAKIGITSLAQDGVHDQKKRNCTVTKLGLEEKICPQSVCEIASEKVAISSAAKTQRRLLRSAKVGTTNIEQRRSPRLAKVGTTNTSQDGIYASKKRDCTVTKLGLEETACRKSICDIASDKVSTLSGGKDQRRLRSSAKVCATNMEQRRSSRLVSVDTTSTNLNLKHTKKSLRPSMSNKSDSSGPAVCLPNVRNKDSKVKCIKKPGNNCSNGRRKYRRVAAWSDKLEKSNCSDEDKIGRVSQQRQPSIGQNASEKVAKLTSKLPLPPNKRRSKRFGNRLGEITRKGGKSKHVEESDSDYESEESPAGTKRKREESAETDAPVEIAIGEQAVGLHGWTEEQEIALRKAYFSARPSPHFWKKVSKMVPGKSAQECFDRIQSNFTTPPSIPPKSRLNKGNQMDPPFKKFNLLELSSPKDQISAEAKTRRVSKQKKTQNARKTLRHLLKKQRLVDRVQDSDYFSQFEASPVILPSDVKLPSDFSYKERLNVSLENNTKPGPSQSQPDPSPAVLKPVKNMELHEKYIDHLHCVDARRKACVRTCSNKGKEVDLGPQPGVIKDAKTALVSEAQDFIGCFKKLQADPFGDCAMSEDEDEDEDVL